MGILAICLVVIPSKEELFSEGIKKAVSNDLVDISIPPAKITGEEGKRKILYTVIVDNKSEYLMRDLKVYIRPEEMVRQNLLPYENEEYLMFECDLSPYSQAIEDTRLQFSAEGTATFMLDDDYIAHKELSSVGAIENDHNVTLRLEWENGEDVYEDPIFTITFETTKADQYWKIIPKANVDAGNTDASAAGVVGPKVDGEDSMTGSLTNGDAKAGKIAKAGKYKLTLNMMDYSYTLEEVNYDPFIYFIGSTDGWGSSDQKLALVDDAKGVYTGYVYIANPTGSDLQFKFQRIAGKWENAIGSGALASFGGAAINAGDNIGVNAGEGVYYMDVNLSESKITATKVETMGMIGGFNNWAGDAPMTWNAEEYCFEATNAGVTADGWKFRVNGGWDINLGGSVSDLTAGGDNLAVAGNTVKLYPTRKTSDKIYCTVE